MAEFKPMAPEDGRPLYLQLADRLRAEAAGASPGAQIESEHQLANRFGVSRFTITRAVEILVEEGLFTRRRGLGTFVAPPKLRRTPTQLASFTEAVLAQGRTTAHRLLRYGPAEATEQTAAYFPNAARLVRLDRLRFVDGAAVGLHMSLLDEAVARMAGLSAQVAADPKFSLYRRLREAGFVIDRATETLQARRASVSEAEPLQLDDDRVVMDVRRETYAEDGRLLDLDHALYDARRFSFESELNRGARLETPSNSGREKGHAKNSNDNRGGGARFGARDDDGRRR